MWRLLAAELVPVALPEHPQVDDVGLVLVEAPLVEPGEVEGLGTRPSFPRTSP